MFEAKTFVDAAAEVGYDLYTGVPCSFLKPFINHVIDRQDIDYLAVNNEGEGIALACGAYIAGKRPIVMLQNSGLGNTVNPLTSLAVPSRIPLLMIVTWRGEPGLGDEPQHDLMGRITSGMLRLMELESVVVGDTGEDAIVQLRATAAAQRRDSLPRALLLRKGVVAPQALSTPRVSRAAEGLGRVAPPEGGAAEVRRFDCVRIVADVVGTHHVIVATTGKTGRELYTYRDSPNHLYVVGAMGCASSIGLGIALHQPSDRRIVIIDGDGAALMRLEAMASIGHYRPSNLVHVLLDNNAHESTGSQQTLSDTTDFPGVARALGYRNARSVCSLDALSAELEAAMTGEGPALIHVRIRVGSIDPLGRPSIGPDAVTRRLRAFLASPAHV